MSYGALELVGRKGIQMNKQASDASQSQIQMLAQAVESRVSGTLKKPKYQVLYDAILYMIESGVWTTGGQLPSDSKLARELDFSLGTVQKVMQKLAEGGIVVRRQGHGTFVAGVPTSAAEIRHFQFEKLEGGGGLPIYSRVLEIEVMACPEFLRRTLPEDESEVIAIQRLASINLEAQAYTVRYLPRRRFAGVLDIPADKLDGASLSYLLGEQFNAPTLRTSQTFMVDRLPEEVCNLLRIESGAFGNHWDLYCYSYRDTFVGLQRAYIPAGPYRLRID